MWIFNKTGFLSIVSKDCQEDELLVRARVKDDLLSLCQELNIEPRIIEGSDYLYTMKIKKEILAKYMYDNVFDIDYDIVRFNIADPRDKIRNDIYLKIWYLTLELTERLRNIK